MRKFRAQQHGGILILTLMTLIVFALIATAIMGYLNRQTKATIRSTQVEQAFHAADAGVQYTQWLLNQTETTPEQLTAAPPSSTTSYPLTDANDTTIAHFNLTFYNASESQLSVLARGYDATLTTLCQTITATLSQPNPEEKFILTSWQHVLGTDCNSVGAPPPPTEASLDLYIQDAQTDSNDTDHTVTLLEDSTSTTLVWTSANVQNCSAAATPANSSWQGSQNPSGSQTVPLPGSGSYRFEITCTETATNNNIQDEVTVVVPTPLPPSHIIFTTSTTYTGDLDSLSGADAICQQRAQAASLSGYYRAIISNSSISARDRITISGAIASTAGYILATNANDLWDGSLLDLVRDEFGTVSFNTVWTGTDIDGTSEGSWCSSWQNSGGAGYIGRASEEGNRWIKDGISQCNLLRSLYCISNQSPPLPPAALDLYVENAQADSNDSDKHVTLSAGTTNVRLVRESTSVENCTATATPTNGGWSGAITPQGTSQVSLPSPGDYTFDIACTKIIDGTSIQDQVHVTLPLPPGSQHLLFVTSTQYTPDSFGSLTAADTQCQQRADAGNLPGTYKALLSNSTTNARDRVTITGPIRSTSNDLIANDAADLWNGSVQTSVIDEFVGGGIKTVVTGTQSNGTSSGYTCNNWTSATTGPLGTYGQNNYFDQRWIHTASGSCSTIGPASLYCLSDAPVLPPPSSLDIYVTGQQADSNDADKTVYVTQGTTSINLTWTSNAVSSCTASSSPAISDWTGSKTPNGTAAITLSGSNTYNITISCTNNAGGSIQDNVIVNNTIAGGHIIFATSSAHTGNLGGLAGADNICQQRAADINLPGTYQAILSTTTTNARDRFNIQAAIRLPNGTKVADSAADLWDQSLDAPINRDQFNGLVQERVWTGTKLDGTKDPHTSNSFCGNWTLASSENQATMGNTGNTSGGAFQSAFYPPCTDSQRLYCLTTTPVDIPPLASHRIFATSQTFQANQIGGLAGADTICQQRAQTGGLPGTYKALLSSSSTDARDRILFEAPLKLPDGTKIADDWQDLWDGTLDHTINKTEFNQLISNVTLHFVWSGTESNGFRDTNPNTNFCNNWSVANGTVTNNGLAQYSDYRWIDSGSVSCGGGMGLYCASNQPIPHGQ